jgi:hypothetical protein
MDLGAEEHVLGAELSDEFSVLPGELIFFSDAEERDRLPLSLEESELIPLLLPEFRCYACIFRWKERLELLNDLAAAFQKRLLLLLNNVFVALIELVKLQQVASESFYEVFSVFFE